MTAPRAAFRHNLKRDDDWETPPESFVFLAKCLRRDHPEFRPCRIYDPFYCEGRAAAWIANAFPEAEEVIHEDKDFWTEGRDPDDYDLLVTNPPFSAMRYVMPMLVKTGKPFAVLCPGESVWTQYTMRSVGSQLNRFKVYAPWKRPRFYKDGKQWTSSSQTHVWCVYGLEARSGNIYYEPKPSA